MIPPLTRAGRLPAGIHRATWRELVERFGKNEYRKDLIGGLKAGLELLKSASCRTAYIDGSFVTAKDYPGDFDVCWELNGVDGRLLDPVFRDFSNRRAAQKARFRGEFFPAEFPAGGGHTYLEFF